MKSAVARFYWSHLTGAQRVLDLGCAAGDLGRYKPGRGEQVYGLDLNLATLVQAREYETVQVWDLDSPEPLPFPDAYFDAVVAKDILEHLQKPWRTVMEIKRVLSQGGIILASVICERGHRTWSDYTHVRGFTMQSACQMFTHAGWEVLGVWRMGGVPLTSRLNLIWLVPHLLRLPPLDWFWTSSYEIKARRLLD
jgi:SAM-dependent methyltransferase